MVYFVSKIIIEIVRLGIIAYMYLHMGRFKELVKIFPGFRAYWNTWYPESLRQLFSIDVVAIFLHLVHEVQGDNHGPLQLQKLDSQIQISLKIGGIYNIDNHIRAIIYNIISGDDFLHGIGGKGIYTRQVHNRDGLSVQFSGAFLFLHGHARPVPHILVGAGKGIEKSGFT